MHVPANPNLPSFPVPQEPVRHLPPQMPAETRRPVDPAGRAEPAAQEALRSSDPRIRRQEDPGAASRDEEAAAEAADPAASAESRQTAEQGGSERLGTVLDDYA